MKKLLLIFITLTMSAMVIAQEKSKQKEVGLVFSSLDNFGLTYKTGSEKSLWRFNTLFISGSSFKETADSLDYEQSNKGFGLKFGKEYRKVIIEKFEFRYGADISFSYNQSKNIVDDKSISDRDRTIEQTIYSPGINLVIGFNYVFKEHLVVGAELLPNFSYSTGKSKETGYTYNNDVERNISGFSYGLSNTSALLSLSYRF